jgi:RHS repeat-associated protein
VSTTLPSGLISTQSSSRTVTLSDPNNPLSLVSQSSTTTSNGRATTTIFNAGAKTYTSTSPAGRVTVRTIDAKGRTTRVQVGDLTPADIGYDAQGRLAIVTQGSRGSLNQYFPSGAAAGYLQGSTDPLSQTTDYTRDALGRVLTETLASITTATTWDAAGNLKTVTPPGKPTHVLNYTPVDLVSGYDPPAAGLSSAATSYNYDVDRALTSIARPDGQLISNTYDGAGRLSTTTIPGGLLTRQYYGASPPAGGAAGLLSSLTGPYGVNLGFTYDGGLLKGTTWSGTVAGSVSWTYDSDFFQNKQTVNGLSGTASAAFGYDLDKLLTCASPTTCNPAGADALVLARSSQNGLVTNVALRTVTEAITYNGFGELATQVATAGATALLSETYASAAHPRDALGRIVRKDETVNGAQTVFDYVYDARNRLSEVYVGGTLNEHYEYDANGNRLSVTRPTGTTSATYDAQDRLLTHGTFTYTYTANGELETKTDTATNQTTLYAYDVLGNLLSVSLPNGTLIEVDGQGRRVGKKVNGTVVKRWLYADQLRPVAELNGAGALVSEFVYGSKPNVPDFMVRAGVQYRILSDQLGSVRLVVNAATGAVAQRMRHDAWGNVLEDTSPGFVPFGFAGGMYDAETGFVRFGARDYETSIGRWMQKDPIRFDAGQANLYAYVNNDPVNSRDPSGLILFFDDAAEGAAALAAAAVVAAGAAGYGVLCIIDPQACRDVGDAIKRICDDLTPANDNGKKRKDLCQDALKSCLNSPAQSRGVCQDCWFRCDAEGTWPATTWDGRSCY